MGIIQGNCLEILKNYPDNHFTTIVTDPPYGLSFMCKKWDYDVPSIDIWKECLRVLKHGGTMLCFAGSRTQHRMACNIEDSGFLIKDCLMWIYGQGFPKSYNIGKENSDFEGYGTALKPAYEPIIMAMKPNDGTYVENAIKWGVAGINIDESRIQGKWNRSTTTRDDIRNGNFIKNNRKTYDCEPQKSHPSGRFPANILFDEESAEMLDEQSGISKSSDTKNLFQDDRTNDISYSYKKKYKRCGGFNDQGGASRFFYCAKASPSERNKGCEELEEKITQGMRSNAGPALVGNDYIRTKMKNNHPTVKPLKLMQYLINLIMPPKDGLLLDPFAGSGTTILACKQLGYNAIGIEREAEYCKIAEARISNVKTEKESNQMEISV